VINKFEQNVCKVLKVRESQKFALPKEQFSTGFSTEYVENSDSLAGPLLAKSPGASVGEGSCVVGLMRLEDPRNQLQRFLGPGRPTMHSRETEGWH